MDGRLLTESVAVKLDRYTYSRLKAVALAQDKSVAGFVRERIEIVVSQLDQPPLAPARREPWRSV